MKERVKVDQEKQIIEELPYEGAIWCPEWAVEEEIDTTIATKN